MLVLTTFYTQRQGCASLWNDRLAMPDPVMPLTIARMWT
jgi:hypothetical protein